MEDSAQTKPVEAQDSPELDQKLLATLAELWKGQREKDLEVRHKTGAMLNERLGDPAVRQKYGSEIVTKVSETTGLNKSDISRTRWFAKLYPDLSDFQEQNPDMATWSAVKQHLAKKLKAQRHSSRKAGHGGGTQNAVNRVLKSLESVTAKLQGLASVSLGANRKLLLQAAKRILEQVKSFPKDDGGVEAA